MIEEEEMKSVPSSSPNKVDERVIPFLQVHFFCPVEGRIFLHLQGQLGLKSPKWKLSSDRGFHPLECYFVALHASIVFVSSLRTLHCTASLGACD